MNGSVAAVIAALIALLAAIGLLTGEDDEAGEGEPRVPAAELSVERVARRLERIRELRFERLPRVERMTPREARRTALREFDRNRPRSDQEAGEALLELLGLLPAGADLRELVGTAVATEVAAFYVPGSNTLALVGDVGAGGILGEATLAHELTHALEDQHFGLREGGASPWRDDSGAQSALHEGTATLAMVDYLLVAQGGGRDLPGELREQVVEEIQDVALPAAGGLPRYVRESLTFPYAAGTRLVSDIHRRGGWAAVDRAYGDRPVRSSEQVMHPQKYERDERPLPVRLRGHRALLPDGAESLARGDLGEFDTEQFLRRGNGRRRSAAAAAGWGGSAFELFDLPAGGHALVMAWAWDSLRDASEFAAAAKRRLAGLATPGAVARGPRLTAVVLAPRATPARAMAERVARG